MSYVVNWRGSDGQAGWFPVGDLPEAAAHVEHLRNVEGVGETKIFRLEEVPFEFRPYFRVELASADEPVPTFSVPAADPAPASEPAEVPWSAAEPAADQAPDPEAELVAAFQPPQPALAEVGADEPGSNGQRRGLFGR